MFRTQHTLGCIVVLAVFAVLLTPGLSHAQRGFHGAGAHYGVAHVGGYHAGGYHVGGYHVGAYHPGYGHYDGGYRAPHVLYGYRPYYGSYGYYPYNSDSFYSADPFYYTDPWNGSGYLGSYDAAPLIDSNAIYGTQADPYQASSPLTADTSAHMTVTVPAGAIVWFDGQATTSVGTVRQFNSPPLTAGKHTYEIRAHWNENGHGATQTQEIEVTPGAHVNVRFPMPTAASGQAAKNS